MTLFKNKYRIESTRLSNWNYANDGCYFVTICTKNRKHFFGEIINCVLTETPQSIIAVECWKKLPGHYHNCIIDEFIVMPNHIHGIIIIDNSIEHDKDVNRFNIDNENNKPNVETGLKPVSTSKQSKQIIDYNKKRYSLLEIIRGFKTFSAEKINKLQNTTGKPFWQPRFYDHIIRNEQSLTKIKSYVQKNPFMWEQDKNNVENIFM